METELFVKLAPTVKDQYSAVLFEVNVASTVPPGSVENASTRAEDAPVVVGLTSEKGRYVVFPTGKL